MDAPSRGSWGVVLAITGILSTQAGSVRGAGPIAPPTAGGAARGVGVSSLAYTVQDAGNLRTLVTNWGLIGSQPGTVAPWSSQPSVEWPKGSSVQYLWSAGLWIGALQNGEPHVTTTQYDVEVRPGALDSIYVSHEGAAGGSRSPAVDADDDQDGSVDEDRLNGRDDDGDGLVDEDFAAISDQMLACEYADTAASLQIALPDHRPLGVRVEQSTFVWTDPRTRNVLGLDYRIVNTGPDHLDDVCAGIYADCDLGPRGRPTISVDDRAGFWEGYVDTELGGPVHHVKISIGYMFDADGDDGQTPGYIGFVYLGSRKGAAPTPGPLALTNYRMFSGISAFPAGDPANDAERYQALSGDDPLALPPPDSTGLRPPQLTGQSDYRIFFATGAPAGTLALAPGESLSVDFALVMGGGFDAMCLNAARAQILYDNDWRPEGPVAIGVQDLEATSAAGGVDLQWRLPAAALHEIRAVRVQRAGAEPGPYADRATLAPQAAMRFVDAEVEPGRNYWYRLALDLASGGTVWGSTFAVHVERGGPAVTGIEAAVVRADGAVEIRYRVAAAGGLDLAVFDARGRLVRALERRTAPSGSYVRIWDRRQDTGVPLASGVYFLRLQAVGGGATRKLVLRRE